MGDAGDLSGFGHGMLLNRRAESKEAKSKMMVKSYERVIVRNSKGNSALVMVFDFVRRWRVCWMMIICTSDAMEVYILISSDGEASLGPC